MRSPTHLERYWIMPLSLFILVKVEAHQVLDCQRCSSCRVRAVLLEVRNDASKLKDGSLWAGDQLVSLAPTGQAAYSMHSHLPLRRLDSATAADSAHSSQTAKAPCHCESR